MLVDDPCCLRRSIFSGSRPSYRPQPHEVQTITGAKGLALGTVLVTKREDTLPGRQIEFRFALAALSFPAVASEHIVTALETSARTAFGKHLEKLKLRKNEHMRFDFIVTSTDDDPPQLSALATQFERLLKAAPQTKKLKPQHE